jgi:hypothetical protein
MDQSSLFSKRYLRYIDTKIARYDPKITSVMKWAVRTTLLVITKIAMRI